jgi:hypothetical protein
MRRGDLGESDQRSHQGSDEQYQGDQPASATSLRWMRLIWQGRLGLCAGGGAGDDA